MTFRRWAVAGGVALAAVLTCVACTGPQPTVAPSPVPTPSATPGRGPITFASSGDPTGQLATDINAWNILHPDEPVTLRELPVSADQQRADFLQRAADGNGEDTVMAVPVEFVPELAEAGAFAPLPADEFSTTGLLRASVAAGTGDGQLVAYPYTADAGFLYYRKDVLKAAGLKAPTTWSDLAHDCAALSSTWRGQACVAVPSGAGETRTVATLEAVQGAGGQGFSADGEPQFDSLAAQAGVSSLADGLGATRTLTSASTSDADTLVRAFERGEVVFMRGWGSAWPLVGKTAGATVDASQVGVAELPGETGTAPSVLGGDDLAISAHAGNMATARDFVLFLTSEQRQRDRFAAAGLGPTIESLYSDPEVTGADGPGPLLAKVIGRAQPRPVVPDYAQLSKAVSDGMAPVFDNKALPADTLTSLQSALDDIVSKR